MKKTLLLIIFIQNICFPQSGWNRQYSGTTNDLINTFFSDSLHGVVVGLNGTILKTSDGGNNWYQKNSGTTNHLKFVTFVNQQVGTIVGAGGTILRTEDGGDNWTQQNSGVTGTLEAVSFYDENNGVAVVGSTIIRTTNGGQNWEILTTGVLQQNLRRVHYFDYNNIVAISSWQQTYVYKTNDGGLNWSRTTAATNMSAGGFEDSKFLDQNIGFILGSNGQSSQYFSYFCKTTNGGASWQQMISFGDLPASLNCISFIDENNGWAVGGAHAFKTTDSGITWKKQQIGCQNQFYQNYLSKNYYRAICLKNNKYITIVGDGGLIYRTVSGGTEVPSSEWVKINSGVTDDLRSVFFTDSVKGICVAEQIKYLRTADSGLNWKKFSGDNLSLFQLKPQDIYFWDLNYGSMVGYSSSGDPYGRMANTTDGGKTWSIYLFDESLNEMKYRVARGIQYIDYMKRIIVAGNGVILHTIDGGVTWTKSESVTEWDLNDLSFSNDEVGYVVGDKGTILKTTDSGINWNVLPTNTNNNFYGVYFTDPDNGTVVGTFGKILKTTDGGATWTEKLSGTYNHLFKVVFNDYNNGIVVGELGTIFISSNGGDTWERDESGTSINLNDVSIKDSTNIIVGDFGTILRNGIPMPIDSSWTIHHSSTGVPLLGVSLYNTQSAVAIGNTKTGTGVAIKTMDGGVNWSQIFTTNVNLYDVDFSDENIGMTVGHNTTFYKLFTTTNSGVDWTTRSYPGFYSGLSLFNKNIAAAVGRDGVIMTTSNGGADWIQRNSGTTNHLSKVCLTGVNTGVAVGSEGTILTTSNSGESWTRQTSGTTDLLQGVSFSDINRGTVVGDNGIILHTIDQGVSWSLQQSGTWENLNGVAFSDSVNGIIVGDYGTILITDNGGTDWIKLRTNLNIDFFDVSIKDSIVLCVGDSGIIYRYTKWIYTDQPPDSSDDPPDSINQIPTEYKMDQNYPNPFNFLTNIHYSIPLKSAVIIKVFDLLGREVVTLVNEEKQAGYYKIAFNGNSLPSGVYFYRLQAGSFVETKKMILLK